MAALTLPFSKFENLAELWHALVGVPLEPIVMKPRPGTATEGDLLCFVERGRRLVELVDGTLLEKTEGWLEAQIALNVGIAIKTLWIRQNPEWLRARSLRQAFKFE